MDAFFAAIEVMDHPRLKGKPVVVGSPPDKRGVVSTASYEARAYGIRSAMPSRTAYKLCPHAVFVPVRMDRYMSVSEKVMSILQQFTPIIEQVSVDEAFMDVRGVLRKWKDPAALGLALKKRISDDIGLTASVGIATNKFLAKLASDMKKPNGLTVVPASPEDIVRFLAPMPVSRIWGVGKVTEDKLHQAGFRQIQDVQAVPVHVLVPVVGHGLADHIWRLARGIDEREVATESETKSISAEHTFDQDVSDVSIVRQQLIELAGLVGRRLRREGFAACTVFIKIRFEDFQTITRQETLPEPVCSDRILLGAMLSLFEKQKVAQRVRLIGVGVSGLTVGDHTGSQLELFANPSKEADNRNQRLDMAMDTIRDKLGSEAIRRASSMSANPSPSPTSRARRGH